MYILPIPLFHDKKNHPFSITFSYDMTSASFLLFLTNLTFDKFDKFVELQGIYFQKTKTNCNFFYRSPTMRLLKTLGFLTKITNFVIF